MGSSSVDGEKSGSSEPVFSWKKLALFTGCAGGLYAAGEERLVVVVIWLSWWDLFVCSVRVIEEGM